MLLFKDKTLMITGGTGSFGNAVLNRFIQTDIGEIRVFFVMRRSRMICVMIFRLKCQKLLARLSFLSAMFVIYNL